MCGPTLQPQSHAGEDRLNRLFPNNPGHGFRFLWSPERGASLLPALWCLSGFPERRPAGRTVLYLSSLSLFPLGCPCRFRQPSETSLADVLGACSVQVLPVLLPKVTQCPREGSHSPTFSALSSWDQFPVTQRVLPTPPAARARSVLLFQRRNWL